MFFKDRLPGLVKIAVLLHKVAAGKLPLIVTFCIIISCVNHITFVPRSVPHSYILAFTVAPIRRLQSPENCCYQFTGGSKQYFRTYCEGSVPTRDPDLRVKPMDVYQTLAHGWTKVTLVHTVCACLAPPALNFLEFGNFCESAPLY